MGKKYSCEKKKIPHNIYKTIFFTESVSRIRITLSSQGGRVPRTISAFIQGFIGTTKVNN